MGLIDCGSSHLYICSCIARSRWGNTVNITGPAQKGGSSLQLIFRHERLINSIWIISCTLPCKMMIQMCNERCCHCILCSCIKCMTVNSVLSVVNSTKMLFRGLGDKCKIIHNGLEHLIHLVPGDEGTEIRKILSAVINQRAASFPHWVHQSTNHWVVQECMGMQGI